MIRHLLIAAILISVPIQLIAEEPASKEPASNETVSPEVDELTSLVKQLGDGSFAVRESAAKRLMKFENAAKPVLLGALEHEDLEIRLRARQLLAAIGKSELGRRLTAFLESNDPDEDHKLPGWHRFRQIVGDARPVRELFVEMVRREGSFLSSIESDAKASRDRYAQRVQSLGTSFNTGARLEAVAAPTLASLLFTGTNPGINMDSSTGYQMYSLLSRTQNMNALTKGQQSEMLRKLLASWLKHHSSNSYLARNGLMLTLQYDMKDVGLEIARKLSRNKTVPSSTLPYAALTLGKFGDASDVALLEPLLENKTVCHSWHNGKFKEVIKIQVRDVVLAVLVHLTEQDHKDYGFELLREYERTLFHIYTCAFPKDEDRQTALAKWKAWSEKQEAG